MSDEQVPGGQIPGDTPSGAAAPIDQTKPVDAGPAFDPQDPETWPEEVKRAYLAGAQHQKQYLEQQGVLISPQELEERRRAKEAQDLSEQQRMAREFEREQLERVKSQLPEGLDPKARDKIAGTIAKAKIESTSEALALANRQLGQEIQQLRTEIRARDERLGWEKLAQYDPSIAQHLPDIQKITKEVNEVERLKGLLEYTQAIRKDVLEQIKSEQEEESRRASMPSRVDFRGLVIPPDSRGNAFSAENQRSTRALADAAVGATTKADEEAAITAYLRQQGIVR